MNKYENPSTISYQAASSRWSQALIQKTFFTVGGLICLLLPVSARNALILQADFGGLSMAGVAYSVSKEIDIFQVRPLIPLYNINAASSSLEFSSSNWPPGTVFVSVVDPGVGTARKSVDRWY